MKNVIGEDLSPLLAKNQLMKLNCLFKNAFSNSYVLGLKKLCVITVIFIF